MYGNAPHESQAQAWHLGHGVWFGLVWSTLRACLKAGMIHHLSGVPRAVGMCANAEEEFLVGPVGNACDGSYSYVKSVGRCDVTRQALWIQPPHQAQLLMENCISAAPSH